MEEYIVICQAACVTELEDSVFTRACLLSGLQISRRGEWRDHRGAGDAELAAPVRRRLLHTFLGGDPSPGYYHQFPPSQRQGDAVSVGWRVPRLVPNAHPTVHDAVAQYGGHVVAAPGAPACAGPRGTRWSIHRR